MIFVTPTCVTPTCVVPRHVDASRDFHVYFFSERAEWGDGGGGGAARLFLSFFFPFSVDHERDWPPSKVVFFELATNALNVRNNNTNNNILDAVAKIGRNEPEYGDEQVPRNGTVILVSRGRILGRERGQENIHFPCSADHG